MRLGDGKDLAPVKLDLVPADTSHIENQRDGFAPERLEQRPQAALDYGVAVLLRKHPGCPHAVRAHRPDEFVGLGLLAGAGREHDPARVQPPLAGNRLEQHRIAVGRVGHACLARVNERLCDTDPVHLAEESRRRAEARHALRVGGSQHDVTVERSHHLLRDWVTMGG